MAHVAVRNTQGEEGCGPKPEGASTRSEEKSEEDCLLEEPLRECGSANAWPGRGHLLAEPWQMQTLANAPDFGTRYLTEPPTHFHKENL